MSLFTWDALPFVTLSQAVHLFAFHITRGTNHATMLTLCRASADTKGHSLESVKRNVAETFSFFFTLTFTKIEISILKFSRV